jgi:hypothetical protein
LAGFDESAQLLLLGARMTNSERLDLNTKGLDRLDAQQSWH